MSVYLYTKLFHLLLFLLMCGTFREYVCVSGEAPLPDTTDSVELFETGELKDVSKLTGEAETEQKEAVNVGDFYSPFILSAGDVLVALVGVNHTNKTDRSITVISKHIDTKSVTNWKSSITACTENCKKQFAVFKESNKDNKDGKSVVKGLMAAVKENKVYMLLVNNNTHTEGGQSTGLNWGFGLAVGGATNGIQKDKLIDWKEDETLNPLNVDNFKTTLDDQLSTVDLFDGSAFVIGKDGKITFVVKIKTVSKKKFFGFIDLEETKSKKLTVSCVDATGECDPQFFSWREKIIMVPTRCPQGSDDQKIKQFVDTGSGWNDSGELTFSTADYLKDKYYFTTIKVDATEVLLFTKTEEGPGKINLWMTDGSRIKKLETVMPQFTGTFYGLAFHANTELFALYQKSEEPKECKQQQQQQKCDKIYFISLNKQLGVIKKTLDAWNRIKNNLEKLCDNRSATVIPCSTDGLVGFLSKKK